ncbi:MAG TPA: type III-B CRISPR-associated protein Cas10/Cmr2, partial [Thermoanaerobaculia bacterium]|nr:type III-B CRISPR-associated protein Cas10/Cmr2 [Thermoanaerobaculia bacterium]
MAHVLIVTLGPIQDFIAAARRSRDLWFGSWLLSELSKATAKAMADECGLDALVFPGVLEAKELNPGSNTSVANKIVVRVPDGKDPAAVAERGRMGMEARLERLRDQAFEKLRESEYFHPKNANAQVKALIEVAWVSAAEQEPNGYREARREAEALLAARKNTHLWNKVQWGGEVPKSSVDGERESVLDESLFDDVLNKKLTPKQVRTRYGVGATERLCAVGLLKRNGTREGSKYEHRFLSTGHLAAWPLFYRTKDLEDPELAAAWKRYVDTLSASGAPLEEWEIVQPGGRNHNRIFGRYDGSLLFEGRLAELYEDVADPGQRQEKVREAREALSAFLRKLGVSTPLPYYAILVADGDHMGKAIERQETFEAHKALSQALDRFAQSVKKVVEEDHGGELIYSGGDDVLAFVPLHRVIACAGDLVGKFQDALAGFPVDENGKAPTLSAGIGVSHFMDPLRRALHLARRAEKLAKVERGSLSVIVDKRSGPPTEVTGPWGSLDRRLENYVRMHKRDQIPDGAAYELRELTRLTDRVKGP